MSQACCGTNGNLHDVARQRPVWRWQPSHNQRTDCSESCNRTGNTPGNQAKRLDKRTRGHESCYDALPNSQQQASETASPCSRILTRTAHAHADEATEFRGQLVRLTTHIPLRASSSIGTEGDSPKDKTQTFTRLNLLSQPRGVPTNSKGEEHSGSWCEEPKLDPSRSFKMFCCPVTVQKESVTTNKKEQKHILKPCTWKHAGRQSYKPTVRSPRAREQ